MTGDAFEIAELKRRLDALLTLGRVAALDAQAARVRVDLGTRETGWLPWLTRRAGDASDWWAPSVGEQVLVLAPCGDPDQALALPAVYSAENAPPGSDPGVAVQHFAVALELRCGSTRLRLDASGIAIDGPVSVNGDVTVNGEVTANGIPLSTHLHKGVTPGLQETGEPVDGGGLL